MDKKYTVFLSSTHDDLWEERREVIHALLELDCIPCSMEIFPSDNDEQFEFIKSVIDECDYYILIIAGRYGTIGKNGKSYTEMEYRYAVEQEIPVLTFIHSDIGSISLDKSEKNEECRKKLREFIDGVSKGKLVKFWNGKEDLAGKVSRTMISAIKRHPAKGWVRGDYNLANIPSTFVGENVNLYEENVYLSDEMYKMAIYYKNQNEVEKSRMFFECCLILNTKNADVLREYGGLYYDNKQFQKALSLWEKLICIQKSCRNYYSYSLVNYLLNNYPQAKKFCQRALECPDDGTYNYVKDLIKKLDSSYF